MARFLGFVFFLLLVGGAVLVVISNGNTINLDADDPDDSVDVVADHERAVDRVDSAVADAVDLAERAEKLASRLEKTAMDADNAANRAGQLAETNDAAGASVIASREAAERARATAVVARRISEDLLAVATHAGEATRQAEEITKVAVDVERSKEQASEAVEDAREAEEELEEAEQAVDVATRRANEYLQRNARDAFYEPARYSDGDAIDRVIVERDGDTSYRSVSRRDYRYMDSIEDILDDDSSAAPGESG